MAISGLAPDTLVQECAAGLVPVRRTAAGLAFAAPPLVRSGPVDEDLLAEVLAVLGLERGEVVEARWADNGPGWVAVLLEDAGPRPGRPPRRLGGGRATRSASSVSTRRARRSPTRCGPFSPRNGATVEDPVTGSLNASLAQWLVGTGQVQPPYVVSQGTVLGPCRPGAHRPGRGRPGSGSGVAPSPA